MAMTMRTSRPAVARRNAAARPSRVMPVVRAASMSADAEVPDLAKRGTMNWILAAGVGLPIGGLAVPFAAFFVPKRSALIPRRGAAAWARGAVAQR
jgi:hypothetical protein